MKIVVITGKKPHMLSLCKKLEHHNIVACFHFKPHDEGKTIEDFKIEEHEIVKEKYGVDYANSYINANYPDIPWPSEFLPGYLEADEYFRDSSGYGNIPIEDIHNVNDINSIETINHIKTYKPDVVICHGGPIYSKELIDSFDLVLNYHSGISPIYNGAHSHMFAFSNKQPYLCGGTLMVINSKIDGGDILGHYLPKLESQDTPGQVFIKNMIGLSKLYDSFLTYYSKNKMFHSIKQSYPAIHFFNCDQWNFCRFIKIKNNIEKNIVRKYERDEQIIEYWATETYCKAKELFSKTMNKLLFNY